MEAPSDDSLGLDRLAFFSDAVIAIAMTLLVLELRLPKSGDAHVDVLLQLRHLAPKLTSFVVSFGVIGLYWEAHHRIFRHVRRYDRAFLWINLSFLFCLAFLPFPTALLGDYFPRRSVMSLYAATVAATGIVRMVLWRYATHKCRLVDVNLADGVIRGETWAGATVPMVFLVSLGVAFIDSRAAVLCWLLAIPASAFARRCASKAAEGRR